MAQPAKVAARIFGEIDSAGGNKGVEYRPLSSEETTTEKVKDRSLESTTDIKINLGQGTVLVDKGQFQAFLRRNNMKELEQLPPQKAIQELLNLQILHYPAWDTMNILSGQKPWQSNVFSFIKDNLDKILDAKEDPTDPLYPFSFLLALLDVKNITLSQEVKRDSVSKGINTLLGKKEVKKAFGLHDVAIRNKIIHDAYTYR